jgi:hypothetical protein
VDASNEKTASRHSENDNARVREPDVVIAAPID